MAGEFEGVADAGLFVAEGEAVLGLAEAQVGDEIEIEAVADPVGAGVERSDGGGGARGGSPGPMPTRWSDAGRRGRSVVAIERRGRAADGAGGALRFLLGHDERAGLQRGGFGDAGRAGFGLDDRRRDWQAVALLVRARRR